MHKSDAGAILYAKPRVRRQILMTNLTQNDNMCHNLRNNQRRGLSGRDESAKQTAHRAERCASTDAIAPYSPSPTRK